MATFREIAGLLDAFVRAIEHDNPPKKTGGLMNAARQLIRDTKRNDQRQSRWTPFEAASAHIEDDYLAGVAKKLSLPTDQLRTAMNNDLQDVQLFLNARYQVQRREMAENKVWLSIKRIDQQQAALHSWRDFQRIKNELVGTECEFIELYPAESRLVDEANQYHLWGSSDPEYRFPLGFDHRQVSYEDSRIGEGQAPLEQEEEQA